MSTRFIRWPLIVLNDFLALTAFAGGVGLMANLNAPPVETLAGSIFSSFFLPGLALFVLVGGVAALAAILEVRRQYYAALMSLAAGLFILFFEFVEVLVIGSDLGAARTLQAFYASLGLVIVVLAGAQMAAQRRSINRKQAYES
jgi:peptidoglycan/LPS O-acetylase OafA/YrhL